MPAAVQTIRDMLHRYEKRAQAEAAERGTRLSYIILDLSSCDPPSSTYDRHRLCTHCDGICVAYIVS